MRTKDISLSQRLTQANARLMYICREWYLGKMPTEKFEAERKDILDFIEHTFEKANASQNNPPSEQ